MSTLVEAINESAAAAMNADPGDLPGIAALHARLATLHEVTAGALALPEKGPDGGRESHILATTGRAMALVEKIVLFEVQDAAAALNDVRGMITEIESVLGGAISVPAAARACVERCRILSIVRGQHLRG